MSPIRVANFFMCIFFSYAAYLQLNDPDSLRWIAMYSSSAFVCLLSALLTKSSQKDKNSSSVPFRKLKLLILLPCLLALLLRYYQSGWDLDLDYKTEDGRENSGMVIVACWMIVNMISISKWGAMALVGITVSICASAYIIPKYLMKKEHMVGHCQGLGFGPKE